MTGTRFANSHGLPDPDNYTTVRDVAHSPARADAGDFPEMYRWHALESFTYNNIKQPNRNRLLRSDPSVDGGKTGYTKAAGYCLAVSANREGMRVVAVVMGAPPFLGAVPGRAGPAQVRLPELPDDARVRGEGAHRHGPGLVGRPPVGTGAGVARDLWLSVERRKVDRIDTKVAFDEPLIAPVPEAGRVGTLEVTPGGREDRRARADRAGPMCRKAPCIAARWTGSGCSGADRRISPTRR